MSLNKFHIARSPSPLLDISYDTRTDILMIDGVRYTGSLFRNFGFGPSGKPLLITRKEDGVVTLFTFHLTDEGIARAREEIAKLEDMITARARSIAPKSEESKT